MSDVTLNERFGEIYRRDPVAYFCLKVMKMSSRQLIAIYAVLYIFFTWGVGWYVGIINPDPDNIIKVFDREDILLGLTGTLFAITIVFFYFWQLDAIVNLLNFLVGKVSSKDSESSLNQFRKQVYQDFNAWYWPALAGLFIVFAVCEFLISEGQVSLPSNLSQILRWIFTSRSVTLWYQSNNWYLYFIFIPLIMVVRWYFILMFTIRSLLMIKWANRMFNLYDFTVQIGHPDNCGGYSRLGRFFLLSSLWLVPIGIRAFTVTINPLLYGGQLDSSFKTIGIYIIYLLAIPIFLISAVWNIHREMSEQKSQILERFSVNLTRQLTSPSLNDEQQLSEVKNILEFKEIITKQFAVWPYPISWLRSFTVVYFLPVLLGLLSFILERLVANLFQ